MRKTLIVVLGVIGLLVIAGGIYVVVRLYNAGYLPGSAEVTADVAPTTIPLTEAGEEMDPTVTSTASATPISTPTASPTTETPAPQSTSMPTSVATPEARETRVVPLADEVLLPDGFGISLFAEGLADPRMMAIGPDGQLYVAERGANRIIRLPDRDEDGVADGVEPVVDGLSAPSSLDFHPDGSLYVGEATQVLRVTLGGDPLAAETVEVIVEGLPRGGHSTRTVLFSPDGAWLYVSVGSSCNVCIEDDPRRAAIVRYRPDGSEEAIYATGLRNAVGITFRPGTEELWATNNGRDWLGDDQPPETVYTVSQGDDAGWPRCHSGRIVDPDYGDEGDCEGILEPAVEMQAHSAPLGLGFYSGSEFPEAYQGDLFVAFHGSWNRSVPTGYKVVRIPLEDGEPGPVIDFAVGWLRPDGSDWGRPVDILTVADGSMMVSDDAGGRIYRIFYQGP